MYVLYITVCSYVCIFEIIVLIFTQWRRPRILENVTQLVPVGSESQEKKVQADREQRVLCQLFFSRERYVGDFVRMFISMCFGVCQVDFWPKMLNIRKRKFLVFKLVTYCATYAHMCLNNERGYL